MKITKTFLALFLSSLLLASCTDTHEAVMRDQIEWLDEATSVLNNVAEGTTSSSEAAAKMKALGRQCEDFYERKEALSADATPEELLATTQQYAEHVAESFQKYLQAVEKVKESGKMSEELTSALENMDAP